MRLPLTYFALAAFLLIIACKRTSQCPAFDSSLLDSWFPYTQNSTYYFSSASGQTDTLHISIVHKSKAYELRTERSIAGSRNLYCNIYGSIEANGSFNHPRWISMYVSHEISDPNNGDINSFELKFKKMHVWFETGADLQSLAKADYKLSVLTNASLNGKTYSSVRLIEPADAQQINKLEIDKLYIARDHGIIGYRTYPAGEEYWIQ